MPRGATCTAAPDRASCAVTRSFVAHRIADLPEPWSTPSTEVVEGAEPYLVALDLGALSRGMACSPQAEITDSTPNLRALEVWQFAPNLIRVPPRSVAFPVAPTLELESDFPRSFESHGAQVRGRELLAAPDALERRTTSASLLGRSCGASVRDGGLSVSSAELVLESRYECLGDGCTSVQSEDRGTCRVVVPWLPLLLPRPFVTGP